MFLSSAVTRLMRIMQGGGDKESFFGCLSNRIKSLFGCFHVTPLKVWSPFVFPYCPFRTPQSPFHHSPVRAFGDFPIIGEEKMPLLTELF